MQSQRDFTWKRFSLSDNYCKYQNFYLDSWHYIGCYLFRSKKTSRATDLMGFLRLKLQLQTKLHTKINNVLWNLSSPQRLYRALVLSAEQSTDAQMKIALIHWEANPREGANEVQGTKSVDPHARATLTPISSLSWLEVRESTVDAGDADFKD